MTIAEPAVQTSGSSAAAPGPADAAVAPDAAGATAGGAGSVPVAMLVRVHLTKQEVFGACQALADADPVLVAAGRHAEASALGDLFELLEDRLTGPTPPDGSWPTGDRPTTPRAGTRGTGN